jgi:hypothetical protein
MFGCEWTGELALWMTFLAEPLHARLQHRLAPLCMGILFAQGRRTVASWLRAAALGKEFKAYYYFLGSLGRNLNWVAMRLLRILCERLPRPDRVLLALDDTPTKRFGPLVEGAGIHHNPTPGPAGTKFLYGHVWVTLAWIVHHPNWGTIALPLLAKLYIRAKDIAKLAPWYRWKFQTKLEQAAELVEWAKSRLDCLLGCEVWVVADGAYAKRPFLMRMLAAGVTVVSRLRWDAALRDLPTPPKPNQRGRGRPRTYGRNRISLAKRAGQNRGWSSIELVLYGKLQTKCYKAFLATYEPVGGVIRVVLVREDDGSWRAYFCTNLEATVAEILTAVADRAAIEQVFHDVKEVHGAGQQQVRNVYANLAVYHLNLWMHTLIELWAWDRPHEELCDRSASPWDDPDRRPSHADRRKALRRRCLQEQFSAINASLPLPRKIRQLCAQLLSLAT